MTWKKGIYVVIALFVIGSGVYFCWNNRAVTVQSQPHHNSCVKDSEEASYVTHKNENATSTATISIKDRDTQRETFAFDIELPIPDHYHPIELHKCGAYAVRNFNYDFSAKKALSGYRLELWRYRYTGEGESLTLLSDIPISGAGFGTDFRIDTSESNLFLIRGYLGQPDYALVVKDLKNKEDVFVLTLSEILKKYPNITPGSFGLGVFTPDNKYHWGNLYAGPYDIAYYRVELGTWKTDILLSPPDLPSGAERDFNFKGWLAYVDATSFTGMDEFTKQIEEETRKSGKQKNLWLYNLFTKQKILVASADIAWQFNFNLSETVLIYELPGEERNIFSIPQ